jgi:hypothetical protein
MYTSNGPMDLFRVSSPLKDYFISFWLLRTADALVSTGLAALGYKYINIGMHSQIFSLAHVTIFEFLYLLDCGTKCYSASNYRQCVFLFHLLSSSYYLFFNPV